MGVRFTLATLASATTLIGVRMARDNSIKVGNMLSNLRAASKVGGSSSRMEY